MRFDPSIVTVKQSFIVSQIVSSSVACSAGIFWVGETLFVFVDSGRLGRVEIVTLTVGARAKEGKGGRGGEKKNTPARYHCSFGKLRTLANGAPDWCGIGK